MLIAIFHEPVGRGIKRKARGIFFGGLQIATDIFGGMTDIPDIFWVWLIYRLFLG